jgi:serine/threonine-protein kinase
LDPNLVAVAPFDVFGSGLDLWHEGMVDLLSRRLDGAGPLRTVAPSVIFRRWSGRADQPSAFELARQTGASLVIYGSLVGAGPDSVRLNATLLEVGARRPIFEIELRNSIERMDHLIDSSVVRLLEELGRTRPLGPLREARTTSLPALKAFLQGEQHFRQMVWDSAQLYFERALASDGGFALALRHLAEVQRWKFGAEDSFRVYAFQAAALNRSLPPRESLLIVADSLEAAVWQNGSDAAVFRTCQREVATWEEAARRYPGDPEVWYGLGEARFHLGPEIGVTLREQLEAFDQAIAIDPELLQAEPHAVSLGIRLGGRALGRRYAALFLAGHPSGDHALGVRIVNKLLGLPPQDSGALAGWADSIRGEKSFERVGEALGRWADPAETGLRLAQAVLAPGGKFVDPAQDGPRLAAWLASRGHVRDAAGLFGSSQSPAWPHLYVDLAIAGAIPAESASMAFRNWRHSEDLVSARAGTAFLATLALPWWSVRGDTLTLHRVRHRAESRAQLESDQGRQGAWQYMAQAARAYLALARQDSMEALHRFLALPDSVCLECDFDRLHTAMLLSAARRDNEAFELLEAVFPTESKPPPRPSETLWMLERGRVAERLGKEEVASQAYAWVAGMWRNADPELQIYVIEARAGVTRLERGGGL